ncbi:MAG TPA: bifunctional transaldolase/phosoglucose isomerase [Bryobacteraceae bacterium]|nr:bifunctional transaldolase/phosoglucose isomerase [Bryobacteraceae bacterium]
MSSVITREHTKNPLKELSWFGQSVWLDYIRRSLITGGGLRRLIEEDGLRGVTSNPSIFEKAIADAAEYKDILDAAEYRDYDAKALYELIAVRDVRDAADILRPVYDASGARDGYVSLEVSPALAHDTQGTLEEARRLWKAVDRPNLMIKVPGTAEGVPAVRQLISEGINVNVTLLFAQSAYEQVVEAFIAGLEQRLARGLEIRNVASVASFFISRIDTAVDDLLAAKIEAAADAGERSRLAELMGKAAIANAKLTYRRSQQLYSSARWRQLVSHGAQKQRLLWASTSAKNPKYRDVMYVEELIGPDTVNTMPPATFDAFRDHGRVRQSLTEDVDNAAAAMDALAAAGVALKEVTDRLLEDGIRQFDTAFLQLLQTTSQRLERRHRGTINPQKYALPPDLAAVVHTTLEDWKKHDKARRLWSGDPSLWTGADEANWLGWMSITDDQLAHLQPLEALAAEVKAAGYKHALLLGMGGSSLAPEVLAATFGKIAGYPELHVLDSTDPAQIRAVERRISYESTVFIVSSKSGTTLEPNIFKQYFFERAKQELGAEEAGNRFIAITDPGSKLQQIAEHDHFRHIFSGVNSIGGRYSALSNFGMVPAAIMGIDLTRFLNVAKKMVAACDATVPVDENPGVVLGVILGVLATLGRDKVTIIASPGIYDLGAWLEQLLAESTGKNGKGLIPVDRERPGSPEVYGNDRVFVYLRLDSAPDPAQDEAITELERAGQPVVRIAMEEAYSLGAEFFRWEIATAVAGSVMGINPFDQPDVEAAKVATRKLTAEYEEKGSLPAETPMFEADGIRLYTDAVNAEALRKLASQPSLAAYLKAHLDRAKAGDYFAVLAFIPMNQAHEEALQQIRHAVRDAKKIATCVGFGPRFLHSTGQAYKGGPNTGVFLQITCEDAQDLAVPGQKYTFGVVKAAQARGDFEVLAERRRRALRVHIGSDAAAGLASLAAAVKQALQSA